VRALAVALALAAFVVGCRAEPRAQGPAADSTATVPAPIDTTSAVSDTAAAADVVRRYYAAIDDRRLPEAYAAWGQGGASSGRTFAQFQDGFAFTTHTRVEITGPVVIEGAAGSLFATVPVHVYATTDGNRPQEFTGTYVVRRVNDVPGATAGQLAWHLHDADLKQVR
jgi:hypothetical protein